MPIKLLRNLPQGSSSQASSSVRALLQVSVVLLTWGWVISGQAEIYQFIDSNGTISLTNVPTDPRYKRVYVDASRLRNVLSEKELEPVITRHSRHHRLHPALVRAVIKAESDFDPLAVSRAGAIGLMQLMPQTAVRMDVRDLYDPEQNVAGGTKYLRQLLDRFHGDLPLALAAYNAGEHVVDRYQELPPIDETRRYVGRVLKYYSRFLNRDQRRVQSFISGQTRAAQPQARAVATRSHLSPLP